MRTLTRFVAAVVPACSVIASSAAHADPVATTATVLKVVDGDTVDIVDDVREVTRKELSAMTDQELLAYEPEHHGVGMRNLNWFHEGPPPRRLTVNWQAGALDSLQLQLANVESARWLANLLTTPSSASHRAGVLGRGYIFAKTSPLKRGPDKRSRHGSRLR